jgi:type IV pilus assembly protein PilW
MKTQWPFDKKGITLIELMVALVMSAIAVAAIYRIFVSQTRAYTVQDQVVEVQQNIRGAMEIMVRDLRMTGFDYNNSSSAVAIPNIPYNVSANSITLQYENYQPGPPMVSEIRMVTYTLNGTNLERTVNAGPSEVLLPNVDALDLACGLDGRIEDFVTQDGVVDNWVDCGAVNNATDKVIAVRVTLTARPEQVIPDLQAITPRTLTSTVALRNLSMKKM